ncbi:MAG: SGNH/GDSL hydrolase family protein [Verrucomicrobiaceae bacterium]|nr:SGNH/GDSL hydrolase family protein [Verrucomicrobiaceae bacterium]
MGTGLALLYSVYWEASPDGVLKMKPSLVTGALTGLLLFGGLPAAGETPPPLLRSGDRIVLVGNTLLERARLYGHLETTLQIAAGPTVKGITLRNLGWSGDSVFGDARSYFGPPSEGRERLATALGETKPNVVLLCYGTGAAMSVDQGWTRESDHANTSAAGYEASRELFLNGYQALLERVRAASGEGLREIVLIAPPPLENLGKPLPDQVKNNRRLAGFRDGIRELAKKNSLRFVDLFAALGGDDFRGEVANPALTEDGVHHGEAGHHLIARELAKGLGYSESVLPDRDLPAREELRAAVIEKDRLFFHRWRPANETYLFLFRKHEQGRNAKEIPQFDPLIAAQEKKIEEARAVVFAGMPKN